MALHQNYEITGYLSREFETIAPKDPRHHARGFLAWKIASQVPGEIPEHFILVHPPGPPWPWPTLVYMFRLSAVIKELDLLASKSSEIITK